MSDATERPTPAPDADAWSTACAEDLAAERERRRARHGPPPGSAAEELRRLADAVAEKLGAFSGRAASAANPVAGLAAEQVVRQAVRQAKAVVDPVLERNPQVFDHLAAAGAELLAAYRSAVTTQEGRWTRGEDTTRPGQAPGAKGPRNQGPEDEGPGRGERIDLD